MNRFERAFAELISPDREGFYSKNPDDPGGETLYGVSRRAFPDWTGWLLVDSYRLQPGFPQNMKGDRELLAAARELYRLRFWGPVRAEELPETIGEKVFDIGVNVHGGPRTAIAILQIALCALDIYVAVDGEIGPKTLQAARLYGAHPNDRDRLFDSIQAAHAGFYVGLVAGNPKLKTFRRGWLRRAVEEYDASGVRLEIA